MEIKDTVKLTLDVSRQRMDVIPDSPSGFLFSFYRGNTMEWEIELVDYEGVPIDVSGISKISIEMKASTGSMPPNPLDPLSLYVETNDIDNPTILNAPASQTGVWAGAYWFTVSLYGDLDTLLTAVSGRIYVRETGQGNNLPPPVVEDLRDEARASAEEAKNQADRAQEIAEGIQVDLSNKADVDGSNLTPENIDSWRALIGSSSHVAVPENQDSAGEEGQWSSDGPIFYFCVSPNKWIQIYGADTFSNS